MAENGPKLFLVHTEKEFQWGCTTCGKVISHGSVYIKICIDDNAYALGDDSPMTCCSGEGIAMRFFDDPDELRAKVEELIDHFTDPESDAEFTFVELAVDAKSLN